VQDFLLKQSASKVKSNDSDKIDTTLQILLEAFQRAGFEDYVRDGAAY